MNNGLIIGIKELVVKVQFGDEMPRLNEIVTVLNDNKTELLVDHVLKRGVAVCLNIRSDLSLIRGQKVI